MGQNDDENGRRGRGRSSGEEAQVWRDYGVPQGAGASDGGRGYKRGVPGLLGRRRRASRGARNPVSAGGVEIDEEVRGDTGLPPPLPQALPYSDFIMTMLDLRHASNTFCICVHNGLICSVEARIVRCGSCSPVV